MLGFKEELRLDWLDELGVERVEDALSLAQLYLLLPPEEEKHDKTIRLRLGIQVRQILAAEAEHQRLLQRIVLVLHYLHNGLVADGP